MISFIIVGSGYRSEYYGRIVRTYPDLYRDNRTRLLNKDALDLMAVIIGKEKSHLVSLQWQSIIMKNRNLFMESTR